MQTSWLDRVKVLQTGGWAWSLALLLLLVGDVLQGLPVC